MGAGGGGAGARQRARAVAVAPDGSTIVAGVAGDQLMVARYLPAGELDGLFGAGGVVLRELSDGAGLPAGCGLAAIALTPEGQIVVAGSAGVAADDPSADGEPGEQVVVGRLSARGVPDSTFGTNGFTVIQLGARSARRPARSQIAALALGPGRTIVVAGRSSGPDGSDRALVARLTSTGSLDARFGRSGRSGRRVVQLGHASAARPARSALHAVAVLPGGAVVVAGRGTDVAGHGQVVLARFTIGGRLDEAFGRGGIVRTQVSGAIKDRPQESLARAIAPTADGNVLVTGSTSLGGAFTLRTAPSGRLDCGYGTLGGGAGFNPLILRSGDAAQDGAFGVLAQPDGHYVAAGRLPGGGVLLGRVLGGPSATAQTPARRPGLRTLGARYLGRGRAVVYGAVLANCSSTTVRFVASEPEPEPAPAPGARPRDHHPPPEGVRRLRHPGRVRDRARAAAGPRVSRADRLTADSRAGRRHAPAAGRRGRTQGVPAGGVRVSA